MSPFNKSVYLNKLRVDKDDNGSCQFQPKYEGTRAHQNQTDEKKHFISTAKNLQEQTTINLIYLHEAKLISSCCKSVNMDV